MNENEEEIYENEEDRPKNVLNHIANITVF